MSLAEEKKKKKNKNKRKWGIKLKRKKERKKKKINSRLWRTAKPPANMENTNR